MRYRVTRFTSQSFTLFELLVVLAILGMLVGLVGPQVMDQLGGSKTKTAKIQIADLGAALDLFRLDVGRYPNASEGLEALVSKPSELNKWNGHYLKKNQIPTEPWSYE